MKKCHLLTIYVLAVLCLSLAASLAAAEDYRIGPGDVLEIKFWQDPALNAQVRVSANGFITLDIVGQIEASGKTTEQLQTEIVRQISRLNKRISQAVVLVVEYNYQYVFVTGQVNQPGKLTFEEIPDLWTLVNEAGGITAFGDLSRVTIIRGGKDAGKVEVVNVAEAIARGQLDKLPAVRREDTIEIGRSLAGVPSGEVGQPVERRNIFYVIGAVTTPGPIKFEENVDIMEALALAGGPAPDADLKKAQIITKDGYYAQSLQFNLEKYARTGALPRYIMRREDTFLLPRKGAGFMGIGVGTLAAFLGAVTSAILIYNQLKPEDTPAGE
ncbi:MAG: polysaccharide biosynthesis/export family protein [candidate division Zixibacteria bacterium]|nr:polysaccharide biosynthesis/export family protein [candidate division Zixibacteria bacterium]